MPKVSKDSATQGGEFGPVTDRADEIEGYSVNFTTFHVDLDQTPVLKGLPENLITGYDKDHVQLLVRYMFQLSPEEQRRLMAASPGASGGAAAAVIAAPPTRRRSADVVRRSPEAAWPTRDGRRTGYRCL